MTGCYLCLIELLNFENIVLQYGNDMLKIRLERILKDLSFAIGGKEEVLSAFNFGSYIVVSTKGESDEELSALAQAMMSYNKQALTFGYPHRGVIIRQRAMCLQSQGVDMFNSKALFEAKRILAKQSIASIVVENELFAEKQELLERYIATFEQKAVIKLHKYPLAALASQGVKRSIESNFAKVGVDKSSADYPLLTSLLQFVEDENK